MKLVATCGKGLEPLLARELERVGDLRVGVGAVEFHGGLKTVWRCNLWLRTANRVLIELGSWKASNSEDLYRGARKLARAERELFDPARTLSIRASTSGSNIGDVRHAALKCKDGLVDGQRDVHGIRSSVSRDEPDLPLRLRLHRNRATLLLDTSGDPLDHRGYRLNSPVAPVRESLGAAAILHSGWDGQGPVVDLFCGSGTLLAEAGWYAMGRPPGWLRQRFAFQRQPGFDRDAWRGVAAEPGEVLNADVRLYGVDIDSRALIASKNNLEEAELLDQAALSKGDAYETAPPEIGPGLVAINPPHGERIEVVDWEALGRHLRHDYSGWTLAVVAGEFDPRQAMRLPGLRALQVFNGPLRGHLLGGRIP